MKRLIGSESRFSVGIVVLFAIISISNSCSKTTAFDNGGGSKGPGPNEVWIQGMAFSPSSRMISAGTTIIWTNKDGASHTVTSTTGVFGSGTLGNGSTYSFTFNTAGTYPYFCSIHPTMTATIVVN